MSTENIISYSIKTRIHDTEQSTTLKQLNISTADGSAVTDVKSLNDDTLALADQDIQYVRLANDLNKDSSIATFDPYSTGYEVTVKSNKIAVYATLTSSDASYVPGYEPRTVDLDYGRNVILIKIVNKEGRERTYTIIANRVDDRESNNLLSNITVSKGKITFDPYTSDYTVTVPKNTKEVTVNATLESTTAAFVEEYTPRKVTLTGDETSAVIKTISDAGIVRTYVITFIKKGTEEENTIKNSVYLSSLSVPGTGLEFDKETRSYSVSVEYETTELPIFAFPESENAEVNIIGNQDFKVGANVVEVEITNGKKSKVYTIYVNRKESGLNVEDDTKLATLTIKDYPIEFDPNVLDYTVKIKREKTLVITATPASNRSEVYMAGNNDLTGFSNIRIKVIAENGETNIYSVDIQKDSFDKELEKKLVIGAGIIIGLSAIIILVINKNKKRKEYLSE
jgi:hypothetical protein